MSEIDELHERVTNLIVQVEHDPTPDGWASICAVEQEIARTAELGSVEANIGRRGAVLAALRAGLPLLARSLAKQWSLDLSELERAACTG